MPTWAGRACLCPFSSPACPQLLIMFLELISARRGQPAASHSTCFMTSAYKTTWSLTRRGLTQ